MQKIGGNKWNRRICKWIASLLTVALLVNQSSLSVLAEEISETVCQCDIRCSADSVDGGCPVCAQDYGRCEGAEDVTDTDAGEGTENPSEGEDVDTGTGEETENPDAGTDTDTDEETENPDADESETDADAEDEEDALLRDEAENVAEGGAVSRALPEGYFDDGGFRYKIINEDENNLQVELGRRVDASVSGDFTIPSTASDGTKVYKVVRIGTYACIGWDSENITIPDSVTSIGEHAFEKCSNLTGVVIPDSVTSIEGWAFITCSKLVNITIPDSVTSIGAYVFAECSSLTSMTIPDSVTSINTDGIFYKCSSLENAILPDSVTFIGNGAFIECSSLEHFTIPSSVTIIRRDAFYDSGLTSIIIPQNVTRIGDGAFRQCYSLESVKMLNDSITIDASAFYADRKLNSLQITLTQNNTVTPPTVADLPGTFSVFGWCADDRSLTFLTKDGEELSDATTPTLAEAVKAYVTADGRGEGLWYGWKIPGDLPVSGHSVTINVNKDDSPWSDRQSGFALSSDNGRTFITDLDDVSNGTYIIYDTTGAADSAAYVKTDVQVKVSYTDADAEVNYYTVTFYNDNDLVGEPQTVLKNKKVSEPSPSPVKDGYTLSWVTYNADGGSTEFDFINTQITAKTDIYASWTKEDEKTFTITASAGTGGNISPSGDVTVRSGEGQQFTITPDDGYKVSSVLVDGAEQLSSTQAINHARAGISDAGNNVMHYDFENVTDNHTLTASFAAISTGGDIGGGGSDDNDDDDDSDDNNGGGGSGGGGSTGGGGDTGGGTGGGGSDGSGGGDTDGGGSGGSDNSGGDSTDGSSNPDGSGNSARATVSDTSVKNGVSVNNVRSTVPASKDSEPKTGDASHMEIYATIAMIAGLSYILLYFADGKNGMTEEEKKEIVAALVTWAKNGSRVKKYAALAVIFLILVYYHSIGKRTTVDWKEVYEK